MRKGRDNIKQKRKGEVQRNVSKLKENNKNKEKHL